MNQAPVHTGVPDLSFGHPMMEGTVGVFWDYQSCPHPEEYTGNTVIRGIRTLALASGSIKQFNVYVNLEPDPKAAQWAAVFADQVLREELHASGVSVLDCPTTSGNMIIVDIFAFALQNRLPTTLVVISADPDLAYGVSLLRQRRFKVILITSSSMSTDTAPALRSQSDVSFTWKDVLDAERTASGDLDMALSLGDSPASRSLHSLRATPGDGSMAPIKLVTDPIMHDPATPSQETVTTPSESYEQVSPSLKPPEPVSRCDVSETITNPTQTTGTISIEHLCEVVDLLVKAVRQRGWPLAEIQIKVASSPNMAWKKTETIAHLEEGVRLGLLMHTVRPQTNKRSELHYYAVEGTLKAKWLQGVPDPVGFLRARTNLTVDAQEDASGPAGSSTHGIQGETGARVTDPFLQSIGTTPARISNPRVSDVPDHLRDIIDALVQADRSRGWPQESIGYYLHRRDIKKWKDPEKVLAALEESVRVGLLVRSVGISKKNKNVKPYYAVEDGLKKSWLSIFGRV